MPKDSRKPAFKYHERSDEDVERRSKQSSSRYDSYINEEVTWFKPRAGENCIRVIPWLNEADPDFDELSEKWDVHWGIDNVIHRNVGPDKGTYLCLAKNNQGQACPMCDVWREEEEEKLKPSDRVLVWLIDRKDEKAGPQLWSMPLGTSKDISAASRLRSKGSDDGKMLKIDHPDEGYDVWFEREGEKDRTRYNRVEVDRDPSPLHDNEKTQDKWLAYVADHRLPDMLKFYEEDYLNKVLSGQVSKREDAEDEDEDDGEKDTGSSRSRRGAKDEDEEFSRPSRRPRAEAEEDSSEEDEEESRPSRSGRSSGRSRPKDDEDEPRARRGRTKEPEEDEEDDETPSRPRGGKGKDKPAERYKSKAKDEDEEGDAEDEDDKEEVDDARGRLRKVGRSGRR